MGKVRGENILLLTKAFSTGTDTLWRLAALQPFTQPLPAVLVLPRVVVVLTVLVPHHVQAIQSPTTTTTNWPTGSDSNHSDELMSLVDIVNGLQTNSIIFMWSAPSVSLQ